ncbi:hypothetical protein ONZ45_g13345 [Pleurotus djamor]|nr:hypothetical protein ONZ45_g13345 [Pleurotus djamor]
MRIPSRPTIVSLIQKVQQGISPVELVYAPHDSWPSTRATSSSNRSNGNHGERHSSVKISILDSSFNPPTLAHLALANSPRPSYQREILSATSDGFGGLQTEYDAKLLLLSVRNADKALKRGDATFVQRLEMMSLLTEDVICRSSPLFGAPGTEINGGGSAVAALAEPPMCNNTAVAIIDEPTFVGKSAKLLTFVRNRLAGLSTSALPEKQEIELTFLLGFDTLERLLSPRYYGSDGLNSSTAMMTSLRNFLCPPPNGDGSRVVCARRVPTTTSGLTSITARQAIGSVATGESVVTEAGNPTNEDDEDATLVLAREFIDSERIALIDIGEREQTFSSSAVRDFLHTASRANNEAGPNGWKAKESLWRTLVSDRIADYVLQEGLYQNPEIIS